MTCECFIIFLLTENCDLKLRVQPCLFCFSSDCHHHFPSTVSAFLGGRWAEVCVAPALSYCNLGPSNLKQMWAKRETLQASVSKVGLMGSVSKPATIMWDVKYDLFSNFNCYESMCETWVSFTVQSSYLGPFCLSPGNFTLYVKWFLWLWFKSKNSSPDYLARYLTFTLFSVVFEDFLYVISF